MLLLPPTRPHGLRLEVDRFSASHLQRMSEEHVKKCPRAGGRASLRSPRPCSDRISLCLPVRPRDCARLRDVGSIELRREADYLQSRPALGFSGFWASVHAARGPAGGAAASASPEKARHFTGRSIWSKGRCHVIRIGTATARGTVTARIVKYIADSKYQGVVSVKYATEFATESASHFASSSKR